MSRAGAGAALLLLAAACSLDTSPLDDGSRADPVGSDSSAADASAADASAGDAGAPPAMDGGDAGDASDAGDMGDASQSADGAASSLDGSNDASGSAPDSGAEAGLPEDASVQDAGLADASLPDAGSHDAGPIDDAAALDGSMTDAGGPDANPDPTPDAGPDAGPDADTEDPDAGPDADTEDPDAEVDAGDCEPLPECVCPDEPAEPDERGCVPEPCAPERCGPDDDCEYVTTDTSAYYVCENRRPWSAARERCETRDYLQLASIETEAEDEFLFAQVGDKTWISGNDREQEGSFVWATERTFFLGNAVNGQPVQGAYTNFHPSEPNNLGANGVSQGDCVILWTEQGRWADADCNDQNGYICEVRLFWDE